MTLRLTAADIQALGFDWPKYVIIEEYIVSEGGRIDLNITIERLQAGKAYYRKQLDDAFAFKTQHGADYSDFTDRFDDYARIHRSLATAVTYLQQIIEAASAR